LVIIRVLHHVGVIGSIRFQLKVCYYFNTIFKILTNLSMFRIFSIKFAIELDFTLFLFFFADKLKMYKSYSKAKSKFELESG